MRSHAPGRRPDSGLTLVEMVIAVTIVAIVLAVAFPRLIASRMRAAETAAVSALRSVAMSQERFRASGLADEDFDGRGEYGTFGEMAARVGVRDLSTRVPEDLTSGFAAVDVAGEVQRSGYVFRIYLPREGGVGQREQPYGGMAGGLVAPDAAEESWVCYVWPANAGISGEHTFVLSEKGRLLRTRESRHSGQNSPHVRAGDAYVTADPDAMTGELANGVAGSGGNVWELVE